MISLVIRLSLLLDADQRVISFQSVYKHLTRPKVVDALIRRVCAETPNSFLFPSRTGHNIRSSVERFLDTYRAIDWRDRQGRLTHFRNRGVAHLTIEAVENYIKYEELHSLTLSTTALADCREPFLLDGDVPFREEQIQEYSDQATKILLASTNNLQARQ